MMKKAAKSWGVQYTSLHAAALAFSTSPCGSQKGVFYIIGGMCAIERKKERKKEGKKGQRKKHRYKLLFSFLLSLSDSVRLYLIVYLVK